MKIIFEILFFIPAYIFHGLGYLAHRSFLEMRYGWQVSWLEFEEAKIKYKAKQEK